MQMGGEATDILPGYRVRIIDGRRTMRTDTTVPRRNPRVRVPAHQAFPRNRSLVVVGSARGVTVTDGDVAAAAIRYKKLVPG